MFGSIVKKYLWSFAPFMASITPENERDIVVDYEHK